MAGDEAEKREAQDNSREQMNSSETEPEQPARQEAGDPADSEGDTGADDEIEARIREEVEAALAEQKDALLRAQAEVQNMRRRCEQDVEKAHKFALEKFASELLGVVDNLERALQAVQDSDREEVGALREGVELTLKNFLETLSKFNIEQIDPQGEPFDPQLHEAMTTQENDDVEPNTVLAVIQKGYTLNGRVIRPARVMVSKPAQSQA